MTIRPAVVVWAVLALVAVEIVLTYARVASSELYHVSVGGAAGGFGRSLVYLNFPVALAAIPLIVVALDRLRQQPLAWVAALVSAGLCAVVVWPGVVDEADLDARLVNAPAAIGVAAALVLTAASGLFGVRVRAGWGAAAVVVLLLLVSVPWIAADLGFQLGGVPVLGSVWQTGELRTQPGVAEPHPAVHLGHHHGMDGTLLALTAFALVPLVRQMRSTGLRVFAASYAGLLLAYGLANALQDAWLEQVVKRGWTSWEIPTVLHPAASPAWLGILAAGAILAALVLRTPVRPPSPPARARPRPA